MQEQNESNVMQNFMTLVVAILLLVVTGAASFFAGMAYQGNSVQVVPVEVTREVIREIEIPAAAAAPAESAPAQTESDATEDEAMESDGDAEIVVTPVIESAEAEEEEAAPEPEVEEEVEEEIEEEVETEAPRLNSTLFDGPLAEDVDPDDIAAFFEIWQYIDREFDGDLPTMEELNFVMIEAALETLDDDYTTYVIPEIAERSRSDLSGSFEGIGAFVRENDNGEVEIVRPMSGRPADLAGLRAGDIIVSVDGEDIRGQLLDEVITKVRGPRDTEVTLGIRREGESGIIEITIVRARIEIPTVESELLDNNIGYVKLNSFNQIATDQLENAIQEMIDQGATSMIFDLRDNPGGLLSVAVDVADLFMPEGVVLYERNRTGLDETFTSGDGEIGEDIPLVVLVNAGSASASELVAGAFQDTGRAQLIGETTFGKGSVQLVHQLTNGGELRVTIARWYLPSGENISDEGIDPNIEVELPPEVMFGEEGDAQLNRAIEFLLNGE